MIEGARRDLPVGAAVPRARAVPDSGRACFVALKLRLSLTILAAFLLTSSHVLGQNPPANPSSTPQPTSKTPWEVSLTVDGYIRTEQGSYVNPTAAADRGWLHLEARYNYEDLRTGSLWIGYNFSVGKKLVFKVTPMVGEVFGRTTGIAPGCEASLLYKKLTLSISSEYVFDTADSSGSFYYSWPQLTYSPTDWFHVGLAAQHTKAFETKLDVQSGFLVGFSYKHAEFTTYVFNLGRTDPTVVLEVGWSF